ncbi:MAG: AsmA-like C-terminal region-containing protein [bacterium]
MRAIGQFRPRRKHLIGLAAAPFIFWVLLVGLMPTRWVAHRLEHKLQDITGLESRIDRVKLTLAGGMVVSGVHLGSADGEDQVSQLDLTKVFVDVDWGSVVTGRLAMTRIALVGIEGNLTRGPDGSWLPRRWVGPLEEAEAKWASGKVRNWLVDVEIRGGRLNVTDPRNDSRVTLTNLQGIAEAGEGYFKMPELRAKIDGGDLVVAVSADRSQEIPIFDGNLALRNVPMGVEFDVLGFICPLLAGESAQPRGRLDLELYVQGYLQPNWEDTLKGRGMLKLDPVSIAGLPLAEKLGLTSLAAEINGKETRLEDITIRVVNPFTIQARKVNSPSLRVDIGPLPLKFTGWTDFDGQLDYAIRTDAIREQLPVGMRGVLDDLRPRDEALAIRGKLDNLTILVNDQPLTTDRYQIRKSDLRNEVQQISRRLTDRFKR